MLTMIQPCQITHSISKSLLFWQWGIKYGTQVTLSLFYWRYFNYIILQAEKKWKRQELKDAYFESLFVILTGITFNFACKPK